MAKSRISRFMDQASDPTRFVDLLGARQRGIDTDELMREITAEWGGASKLARDIREEFAAAKPGSVTRQRILEMLTRIVVQATEREHVKVRKASDMTNEELVAFVSRIMDERKPKEGHDGLEAKGPEEARPDH